jgi:hypothetical protein
MICFIPEEIIPGMHCLMVFEMTQYDNTEREGNKWLNVYATKAQRGRRDIAPLILNFDTRWR